MKIRIPGLTILDRYIIKKFLGTFFYSISLLQIIIIIFDVSERIDDFIKKDAPLHAIIFDYYLNFLPFFINMFISLFCFISVIFFTSQLAARTEIIAMLNSGMSFKRLMRPYLLASGFLAISSIFLSNYVIPITNEGLRNFELKYIKAKKNVTNTNIHMQIEPGVFVYLESFDRNDKSGLRFTLEKFENQRLVSKLMADRAVYDSTKATWRLENWVIRNLKADTIQTLSSGNTLDTAVRMTPSDFLVDAEDMKIMTAPELDAFIEKEKLKGSSNLSEFLVEKYRRTAFPLSAIILTIIGLSLSSRKVRGGIGMHLGLGIAITFSYILFMQITTVFSRFGNLPPLAAVWIPNILYAILAVYLYRKAPK